MSGISQTHEKPDFAAVYDANYDRVFKYAYTLLLNREDAEDVTADAFVAAYLDFDRYDPQKASAATWLTRIVHNRAVNLLRSAAYRKRSGKPEVWEPRAEGADLFEQAEASDAVVRLYARLLPEEREFLNMRYVMGLKDSEIGALLGLQVKTVNKRYQRLLAKCRLIMNDMS